MGGPGLDQIQFFGSGLDLDWKISQSTHLRRALIKSSRVDSCWSLHFRPEQNP